MLLSFVCFLTNRCISILVSEWFVLSTFFLKVGHGKELPEK